MKTPLSVLLASLVLTGCVSMKNYKPVVGEDGLYRTTQRPEGVIRLPGEEVVTVQADAKKVLATIDTPGEFYANARADRCSAKRLYRAKVAQLRAEQQLKNRDWPTALASLNEAHRECGELHFISAQEYYLAVAHQGLGDRAQALIAAQRFLKYAAAYRPETYFQSTSVDREGDEREWAAEQREFKKLREAAQSFVDGQGPLEVRVPTVETPKFYHNGFFRPGGNRREGGVLFPAIGFGGPSGTVFGALGYLSWGNYGAGVNYQHSSATGDFFGAKLRKSVYESEIRDLDVEAFAAGRTKKKYSYRLDSYGDYQDVKVLESSFNPGAGVGATKRFVPEFGVSAQLIAYADQIDDDVDWSSSLYSFYDLNSTFTANAGWIYNRPMFSISLLFVHLGYNFREQEVNVLIQGIDF